MKSLSVIVRRILWFPPTIAGLIALTFIVSRVIPADPVALVAGEFATKEQVAALRAQLGLDRPMFVQLAWYCGDVISGNLGRSLYTGRPIAEDLLTRIPATLELTFVAIIISITGGVLLGVIAAQYHNSWFDHVLRLVTVSGLAVASFWLALMLQLLFTMRLGWTPLQGRTSGYPPTRMTGLNLVDALLTGDLTAMLDAAHHLLLPAVTLALPAIAIIVRFTRVGVLDHIQSNFVLYQSSMGFPRRVTIWKYVLRSAITATITQIGLIFGVLLAGAVVVETVFTWPGIGSYAVESIMQSDYNAILGVTIWSGIVFSMVNLMVDLLHIYVDPRQKG
ncbi:MAG: ABC transporter permease [Alphaproteobacteria bacterium]|nr:ABC transporter permease [Alphaproteobacteria bacterium]